MQLNSVLGAVDDATAGPAVEDAAATADFGARAGQPSDQHAIRTTGARWDTGRAPPRA
jgi:hypothetical protein